MLRSFDAVPFPQKRSISFLLGAAGIRIRHADAPYTLQALMHLDASPAPPGHEGFREPEGYEGKSNDNMGISSRCLKKTRFTYTKTYFFVECLFSLEIHRICNMFVITHGP